MRNPNAFPREQQPFEALRIHDIVRLIISYTDTPSRTSLMRVSSLFNELVPPFLYGDLILSKTSSSQFFRGMEDDPEAIFRKARYLDHVQSVTFLDVPSFQFIKTTKMLMENYEAMDIGHSIFPNVKRLIFTSNSIIQLTTFREEQGIPHPFIDILKIIFRPHQMCITDPVLRVGDYTDYISSKGENTKYYHANDVDSLDKIVNQYKNYERRLLREEFNSLILLFSKTLYSLTLHQVGTSTQIPTWTPITNIFFRSCECEGNSKNRQHCYSHTNSSNRKTQLKDLARNTNMRDDNSCVRGVKSEKRKWKLINPVVWEDNTKSRGRLNRLLTDEESGWKEENIELLGWDEAEACGCCGSKEGY
ncbi:uncharacterized protein IL334_003207 [Kwoniella shivajii]|uniref:F-box domain-containing protein n=1 Tax=Kwoniella shivajii TaxID=564305 RepID=A0ABZ1CY70_9TREE|nr:hypothetical protein IL334_003207 [Kwoniella shivajii]